MRQSLRQIKIFRTFALGALLAFSSPLSAGTRELLVNSPHDGQSPYLLVFPDDASKTTRAEGVYSVAPDGTFGLLLGGGFLRHGANKGILEHFSLTKYSGRHEIAVVSAGKIYLLQQSNTEKSNTHDESVIAVGQEGFSVIDPFTNEEIDIPSVTSLTDIQVVTLEADSSGQTVLISIRDAKAPARENTTEKGITFAFVLRPKKSGETWLSAQSNKPLLVDYKYRSREQLLQLAYADDRKAGDSKVISTRVLHAYAKPKSNDSAVLKRWRSGLKSILEAIESGGNAHKFQLETIPFLDVADGEVRVDKELMGLVSNAQSFRVLQYHNPVTGIDTLAFPNQTIPGRVTESRGRYHFYMSSIDAGHYLTQMGGDLYYLTLVGEGETSERTVQMTKLPSSMRGGALDELSFSEVSVGDDDTKETYVVVSGKRQDEELTESFTLEGSGPFIRVKKQLTIANRFLRSEDLKLRLKVDELYAHPHAIFDIHTDNIDEPLSYVKRTSLTVPYLDLTNTESMRSPVQMYSRTVSSEFIASNVKFLKFQEAGPLAHTSILSITNNKDKIEWETKTELLKFSNKSGVSDYILGRYPISYLREDKVSRPIDFKISVIATDSSFKGGKSAFSLVTVFSDFGPLAYRADGHDEATKPTVFEDEFHYPFEELVNVAIVPDNSRSEEVQIFFTFKANPEANRKGAVYAKTILLRSNSSGVFTPEVRDAKLLVESEVSAEDLKSRIFLSKKNGIHFSMTPSASQNDRDFKVKCLVSGEETVLDSPRGRGLKLNPLSKERRDSGDSYSIGDSFASWKKMTGSAIAAYFKDRGYEGMPAFVEALSAEAVSKVDTRFPGLNRYLEDLTDPGKSPRHEVLLVSKDDKLALMRAMAELLGVAGNKFWHTSYSGGYSFDPFLFQVDKASQDEVIKNLRQAATLSKPAHTVVIADAKDLNEVRFPTNGDEDAYTMKLHTSNQVGEDVLPHVAYLFATDGEKIELEHLKTPRAPRSRSLIIATPDEFETMKEGLREGHQVDAISQFSVNKAFLSLKWRLWNSKSPQASPQVLDLVGSSASSVEDKILPDLLKTLEAAADIKQSPKISVIIVPDTLIDFVDRSVLSTWVNAPEGSDRHWSQRNHLLRPHLMSSGGVNGVPDQRDVLDELAAASNHTQQRSVLIVRGSMLANNNEARPQNSQVGGRTRVVDQGFLISDYLQEGVDRFPHLLYLIASEGRRVNTKEFSELDPQKRTMSVIITASQSQWASIKNDTAFEQRFNLNAHFSEIKLEQPSIKMKLALMNEVLDTLRGKMLNLTFDLDDSTANRQLTPLARQEKLLTYLISRVDTLASQHGKEPITAFLKVLSQFRRTVVEDPTIRSEGHIDKKSVERMLSQAFGIPMNLNILPPNDPLVLLANEEKAVRSLQQAGYEGSAEVKLKYVRAILSQTRTVKGARNIPSSVVFFGESGNGKTFLWETFVKWQGFQVYNFNAAKSSDNFDAEAMLINFQLIRGADREKSKSANQTMTAAEMINHIERFLISPRGYRGYILLDDVHKAPPKERWEVLSYIQYLFDAPNGIARIKDEQGNYHEISVRNLNLAMSINPPEDPKVIADLGTNPTIEQIIVAQLKSENCPFDLSALKRWGLIINFNKFPISAKAPKLRDTLVESSRDEFNVSGKLTVVSPQAIRDVVGSFGTTNAREFLGEATGRLLSLGSGAEGTGPGLELVLPKRMLGMKTIPRNIWSADGGAREDRESDQLARFISDNMVATRVSSASPEMKPYLLPLFLDVFRTSVHESLITSITADERFIQRSDILLTPFLHAASSNLLTKPALYLKDLRIDPADFGVRPTDPRYANLLQLIANIDRQYGDFFPIKFTDENADTVAFNAFTNHEAVPVVSRSRLMILNETVAKVSDLLKRYLAVMLRVGHVTEFPDASTWLQTLEDKEPRALIKEIAQELVETYLQFFEEMGSSLLYENQHVGRYGSASSFDLARLFLMSMDKATTELPWGKSVGFMLNNIEVAAREGDLGQLPGAQFYLFKSKFSIMRPAVHDAVAQLAEGSDAYKLWSQDEAARHTRRFNETCAGLFAPSVE